jgi:hypothetical protein
VSDNYGELIGGAIRAVAQLHNDTSRLLVDCEKRIGDGRKSIFGNWVTQDLTYNLRAERWMAEGVFLYYLAGERLADAITVTFLEKSLTEPMFLIARIRYADSEKTATEEDEFARVKSLCKGWDLWYLYFRGERLVDHVMEYRDAEKGRIESAKAIAVPLYSIRSIEDVVELRNRLCADEENADAAMA